MTTLADGPTGAPGPAGGPPVPESPTPESCSPAGVLARADGVQLLGEQPGSGYRVAPALVQRSDGQVLQLTPLLYAVLSAVDGRRDDAAVAEAVSTDTQRAVTGDNIRTLVAKQLRPLGLLRLADGSEPAVRKANPLLALRFRYVVSEPTRTRRLTAPFATLFNPVVVTVGTLAFAAVAYWVLFHKGLASAAHDAFADPGMLLAVFALTVVSAGFHEFGHAAALRRGGGTPGAMGAGIYLVWPAFYTDVTDSYRLDRRARLRTDLGGLYFNALVALGMFGIWAAVRWDGLLLVIATQILQMIRQLPPMLRFDGYHLLADITGVPDLFHRIKPTLLSLWPPNWRSTEAKALKPWARVVVTLWVLAVVPLMLLTALVTVVTLPRILATAGHSFATQWALLTANYDNGDWLGVGAKVLALIAVAIPVFGVSYIVTRMVRQIIASTLRRTKGKPVQRTVAATVAVAIVAALLWAWWPRGNYRTIQPYERGTLQQVVTPVAQTLTGRPLSAPQTVAQRSLHRGQTVSATTVWPGDGTPLPTANHPRLAVVLTPRDASKPTWVFPFDRPGAPKAGDNQAMAIATKNGSTVYDVSFALVTASKNTVLNRNEAYAFANCRDCTAVAISFQVVLIVGNAHVAAPQNLSAAVGYNCVRCVTEALAIQLAVSLPGRPDATTAAKLDALWAKIRQFGQNLEGLSLAQIATELTVYQKQILTVLGPSATATSAAASSSSRSPTNSSSAAAGDPAARSSSGPVSSSEAPSSPAPSSVPSSSSVAAPRSSPAANAPASGQVAPTG